MFVIPNHPKAPYLKALLVFILSTRYRATLQNIEDLWLWRRVILIR